MRKKWERVPATESIIRSKTIMDMGMTMEQIMGTGMAQSQGLSLNRENGDPIPPMFPIK